MRILVTGTNHWNTPFHEQRVSTVLNTVLSLHDQIDHGNKLTIVYGNGGLGVAGIVDRWVLRRDPEVVAEQLPIDNVSANKALAVALAMGRVDLWLGFLSGNQTMVQHFRMTTPVVPYVVREHD
jgi:hypothetical protein